VCFQPGIRQSATQTLNVWVEKAGLPIFVEAEILADALKLENPILRAEVDLHNDVGNIDNVVYKNSEAVLVFVKFFCTFASFLTYGAL